MIISSDDPNINLKVDDFQIVLPATFLPVLNLVTSIFGSLMTLYSVYLLIKNDELHFMISSSYQSATILSFLYFQLFITYISLGLQYFPRFGIYTQFMTMSGVACFLASLSMSRLGIMFFRAQYSNHALLDENTWASPLRKYVILSNLLLMISGIVALILSKYPIFSYYILPFYLFPLHHIWRAAQLRTKRSFIWYFQLIVWFPCITHPIFIRGSSNNYLTLVPWPSLQYILIILMSFMVGPSNRGVRELAAELLRPAILRPQVDATRPLRVREDRRLAARKPGGRRLSNMLLSDQPKPRTGCRQPQERCTSRKRGSPTK